MIHSRGGLVVVDQANQVLRLIPITNGARVSTLAGVPATLANPDGGSNDGAAAAAQFSLSHRHRNRRRGKPLCR